MPSSVACAQTVVMPNAKRCVSRRIWTVLLLNAKACVLCTAWRVSLLNAKACSKCTACTVRQEAIVVCADLHKLPAIVQQRSQHNTGLPSDERFERVGESALHCLVTTRPVTLLQGDGIAGCSLVQGPADLLVSLQLPLLCPALRQSVFQHCQARGEVLSAQQ